MSHSESPLTRPRPDLLILDARLPDGTAVDIAVDGSMISEVAPAGTAAGRPASHTIDASGALALPALAEPHAHLDKALTAGRIANPTNDLAGAIVAWIEARPSMTIGDTADRALRAAHELVANGAGVIRTHVDTGRGIGADGVEALESVRRRLDALVELQLVVCASFPLTGAAGADNLAIARDALQAGRAVAIGGAPYLDERPREALDLLADLATDAGLGLDLHVDETLDATVFTLPHIVALAERGFPGSIVAGHCVSLGVQPTDVQRRVSEQLAAAGVSVVTLPQTNLYLQGRDPLGPTQRGLPRLRVLLDAGVNLAVGGDNVRDPFNPMGRNDPLESAALAVAAGHLTPAEAYHAASVAARRALGVPPASVEVGGVADLVLLRTSTVADAVAGAVSGRRVIHRGREVAETIVHTHFAVDAADELPRVGVMSR